ncbi:MAG: L,D-transpeptidase family protein, partial [Pseudomonadota bacterium]
PDISYDRNAPAPASVLAAMADAMADAKDVAAALDAYEPHAPGYLALKAKLAQIRAGDGEGDGAEPRIPNGPVLRIGSHDERVPALRERLGVPGDGSTAYGKALAAAVKKIQREHGIRPTGMLTTATLAAINGPRRAKSSKIDIILANMERWRWMPHHLGKTYVMINLPDFTAAVFHDGKRIWKTKIVIGKPSMATPIMTVQMKFITINPIWHVPPSIVNNEYLPALEQDPTVMQRMGLVVDHNRDGTISIWQPPGDHNALGRIRFNFPNKFLVYQHDTPDKYMFGYARRAFSHGCMRTQDPVKYAVVLLSLVRPQDHYTEARIKSMYGPNEINIDFPAPIPVHVTYQTAFVDHAGKLEFRDDIYGRDREVLALLNGPERRVADIPIARRMDVVRRKVLAIPDQPSLWRSNGFFSQLFGGGFATPSRPPRPPRPLAQRRRYFPSSGTYDR